MRAHAIQKFNIKNPKYFRRVLTLKKTNKAAKRALSLLLALFFVISAFPDISGLITTAASADPLALEQIKVGEYFLMGKYYEKPILWRNINNDENNNPLMFSDKIIAIKVADAMTTKKNRVPREGYRE